MLGQVTCTLILVKNVKHNKLVQEYTFLIASHVIEVRWATKALLAFFACCIIAILPRIKVGLLILVAINH